MTKHQKITNRLDIVREAEKTIIKEIRDGTSRGATAAELYNHRRRLSKIRQELQVLAPVDVLQAER